MNDEIKSRISNRIKEELKMLQENILNISVQTDKSGKNTYCADSLYSFYTIDDLFKNLIKRIDKGTLLYNIFNIKERTLHSKVDFYNNDFDSPKANPHISTLAEVVIKELKVLSNVSNIRFYINNCGKKHCLDEYEKVIDSHIEHIDNFNSRFFIKFDFNYYNDTIDANLIFDNLEVECDVFGISNCDIVSLWIEYLINSFVLFRAGNKELALFTAFASLDCFIEILNDICIEVYNDIKIDNLNLKNFSVICRKFENYNNSNRRLIKEKLKTILNEISMSDGCKDIFKYFVDAEEKRNNIAHCNNENKYQENDYENFIINYLKLLYILRYNKGIEAIVKGNTD